jgi:FdhE protein
MGKPQHLLCPLRNDEPNTINYISVEDDPAYQIYTCDKCKGYLKTYDERTTGKTTDLFIANIETIYLDLLAQEKGYVNHDAD